MKTNVASGYMRAIRIDGAGVLSRTIAIACVLVVGCGGGAGSGNQSASASGGAKSLGASGNPVTAGIAGNAGATGSVGNAGAAGSVGGGAADGGGPSPADLTTLITGDWTMNPGQEGYTCVRKTVTEDMFVNMFEAIIPVGTHHTLLTMGPPDKPDGTIPCSVAENRTLDVFSSGVGTDPFRLPAGIAVKVPKGTQLLLNLHLFNSGTDPISGTSGTLGQTIPATDVTQTAEGLLAGTVLINLPPQKTSTTVGGCLMTQDTTLIAVAPHMHVLGSHMKVTAQSSIDGSIVIHDAAYNFNEQSFKQIKPLKMAKGDNVRVECTHTNNTDNTVTFGESTLSEMCFAGLFRYPATGDSFICTSGPVEPSH